MPNEIGVIAFVGTDLAGIATARRSSSRLADGIALVHESDWMQYLVRSRASAEIDGELAGGMFAHLTYAVDLA